MIRPTLPLSTEECIALVGAAESVRNRALIAFLWRSGLRAREAVGGLGVRLSELRPEGEGTVVTVARPKGFQRGVRPRQVGLDAGATVLLRDYLTERGDERGPVFLSRSGAALHPSYLRQLLPRLGAKLGWDRRVHAHALRATFALGLYTEGIGMLEIMLALGHRSLNTTQIYLRGIGASEVVNATIGRTWQ